MVEDDFWVQALCSTAVKFINLLQPLDVAVFKSFKDQFFKSVRALSFSKKNFEVSKRDFAAVVKEPFEKAFSMSNIKAGFSKAGI